MNKKIFGLALAAVFSAGTANAIIIDNFDTGSVSFPGIYATGPNGTANGSQTGSMLGGNRTIELEMLSGTGASIVTVINPGVLDINNGVTERSKVNVIWDFIATDFTDGGLSEGLFLALPSPIDNDMTVNIDLISSGGTSNNSWIFSDGSSGNDFFLSFAEFTGSADMTSLISMELAISSTFSGLDTQIDMIETRPKDPATVPEPGTLLLLGVGLTGLGFGRRKAK